MVNAMSEALGLGAGATITSEPVEVLEEYVIVPSFALSYLAVTRPDGVVEDWR
jgi:hypothetical protein